MTAPARARSWSRSSGAARRCDRFACAICLPRVTRTTARRLTRVFLDLHRHECTTELAYNSSDVVQNTSVAASMAHLLASRAKPVVQALQALMLSVATLEDRVGFPDQVHLLACSSRWLACCSRLLVADPRRLPGPDARHPGRAPRRAHFLRHAVQVSNSLRSLPLPRVTPTARPQYRLTCVTCDLHSAHVRGALSTLLQVEGLEAGLDEEGRVRLETQYHPMQVRRGNRLLVWTAIHCRVSPSQRSSD